MEKVAGIVVERRLMNGIKENTVFNNKLTINMDSQFSHPR